MNDKIAYITSMGTNFYHKKGNKQRHIGKSSMGWYFALHVYPDECINNLEDWKRVFKQGVEIGYHIENEYGDEISIDSMLSEITDRGRNNGRKWSFQDLERNYAEEGKNNLVRYKIRDGVVGHGEGTWDYLDCDFS